jgi:CHAT domain-containing protein/tetratricopeptide (TPR) repeat protein
MLRLSKYLGLISLFVFTLTDGSGQDARFYGRRADHEVLVSGKVPEALALYQLAYKAALAAADLASQTRSLSNIGACQLALFRYQEAEHTLLHARNLANTAHEDGLSGSSNGNLAEVYAQMHDLPTAELYARESLDAYSRTNKAKEQCLALQTLADILSREQRFNEGEQCFLQAIDVAAKLASDPPDGIPDWSPASSAWRHYGQVLLQNGQLESAAHALTEGRKLLDNCPNRKGEDALLWNLSRVRLRQNRLGEALQFINSAIQAAETGGRIPSWRFFETRAEVELARGDAVAALKDARKALERARILRATIIPDNENRVGVEGLQDEVSSVLINAGNQIYWQNHDPVLLRETFEASEENRAESLTELRPATSSWRAHLPKPQYWDKLSELITAERLAVRFNSGEKGSRIARLRGELSEMEETAKSAANAHAGTVLDRVNKYLPAGAALLSFRLDNHASWLWVVGHGELRLYRLPPKAVLLAEIKAFEDSVQHDDSGKIGKTGLRLYKHLFGGAAPWLENSSLWFISADEPLNTIPMAALVVNVKNRVPLYLTQRKTLQILPGAQLFDTPARGRLTNKRFVAAGDGIYNRADPRYGRPGLIRPAAWSMARLPASGAEVRFAATFWHNTAILTGENMTRAALIKEIDRDPDVIHIASHVIASQDRWGAGILALRMDKSGEPDLLTPQEILLHPIHSRLVVMTGCSSGSGESLPASGLMGLTRAWLAAGAGEVLATRWPTRDEDSDGLIGSFYLHLLASRDGDIPEALREARQDMIARGGWRAEPRYWSSFFLIGVR